MSATLKAVLSGPLRPSFTSANKVQAMHRPGRRLQYSVMWAMIPLAFLSGIPRIGCICASGERKLLCARHLNSLLHGSDQRAEADDALCECCYGRQPAGPAKSCCGRSNGPRPPSSRVHGASSPGCTSVVNAPVLPPLVAATLAPHSGCSCSLLVDTPQLSGAHRTGEQAWSGPPLLPAVDRVVLHQVFLI